jgi:hypothetical protein
MADITTTQVFSDGEKGITATKMNNIVAGSTIQTDFYANKPAGSALNPTDQLLELTSGGTYARITGQVVSDSVATSPSITNMRLRSFNAVGNPNFAVTQRNCGNALANPATSTFIEDRWQYIRSAITGALSLQKQGPATTAAGCVPIPGLSYLISDGFLRATVTTAQASLGAGDYVLVQQSVEGPLLRELWNDVSSISVLVRTSVAGLKISVALRDSANAYSLVLLGTIPNANTWTLLTFPSIPIFTTSSGNWSINAGAVGYVLSLTLAAGTTFTTSTTGAYVAGNYLAATGTSNFLATNGATIDFAFVQHEPGGVCSQLMDLDFQTSYDRCLRYFAKSYDYDVRPAASPSYSYMTFHWPYAIAGAFSAYGGTRFPKPMAKVPTVTAYNNTNGAANQANEFYTTGSYGASPASGAATVTSLGVTKTGVETITLSGTSPGPIMITCEYIADTGF